MGTELVKIWSFRVFTSETKDNEKQGKEPFSLAYMQVNRLKNERHFIGSHIRFPFYGL